MLQKRIIPCLLLRDKGLVKTIQFKDARYIGDPINAVRIFNEKEVDELVFLDITASKTHREPNIELVNKISDECNMPLAYGGGVRSIETIRHLFNAGVEKVCLNTYAIENPAFIKEASDIFGCQSIVVALDAKRNWRGRYEIFTYGGTRATGIDVVDFAKKAEQMGAGEIFLNSIDRDGMMNGYDIELIRKVSDAVNVPLIACGGAGKLSDFEDALNLGKASAVAAGSFFVYHGKKHAVLINFPTRPEIDDILTKKALA